MNDAPAIEPGSLVILEHAEEQGDVRTSVVVEAVQDGALLVAQLEGVTLPRVAEGDDLRVIILEHQEMFAIAARATRVSESSMRLALVSEAERVVRRQYVRIAVDVPVSALILNTAMNTWAPFQGVVTDISAGGMALAADVIAPVGATVVISIAIPDEDPVVAIARTLVADAEARKVVQLASRGPLIRLEYTSIREADRERLIRFIFSEMLKQRRIELERREAEN